jgi:hypothetical protein
MKKHECEGENCTGCPTCARAGNYDACAYVCGHNPELAEDGDE